MTDEKYISIEFEKWETYYKPLEEEYKKVKKELQDEKSNKELLITVRLNTEINKNYSLNHNLYIPEFFHNNINDLVRQLPDIVKQNIISNYSKYKRKSWFSKLFS